MSRHSAKLDPLSINMKNVIQLILIVIIIGIRTDYSFSQNGEYNIIRISRISYIHTPYGKVVNQLKIDLETNKIYFKKRPNRKFKEI